MARRAGFSYKEIEICIRSELANCRLVTHYEPKSCLLRPANASMEAGRVEEDIYL